MLVYENEITLVIFDEEDTENLQPDNTTEQTESQPQSATLKLKGIFIYAYICSYTHVRLLCTYISYS